MRAFAAVGLWLAGCALVSAAEQSSSQAEAAFRAGQLAAQSGNFGEATRNYRVALQHDSAPRIRLELAVALLRTGEFSEAHRLFKDVYSDPSTPLSVKRNILPLMEEAELRVMRIRFGSRLVTDSNPTQTGKATTIYFNGAPMTYEPPQEREVAYGIEPYLTVERLWAKDFISSVSLGARLFERSELNAGTFGVSLGKRLDSLGGLFIQARIDGEYRDDYSYALPSVDMWRRFAISQNFNIGLGAQVGYMVSENSDISGGYYRPYIFGDMSVLSNVVAFGRLSFEHLDSRNAYYSYTSPRLDLGVAIQAADWTITPQIGIWSKDLTQFDEFWGKTRKDLTVRSSIALWNDNIEFRGIKPELNLFYERRDSNIEINSYDQFGGFINLRRAY